MMMMTITKIFIDDIDDDDIHIFLSFISIYERYRDGSNIKTITNNSTPKGKLTNFFLNYVLTIIMVNLAYVPYGYFNIIKYMLLFEYLFLFIFNLILYLIYDMISYESMYYLHLLYYLCRA